MSLRDLRKQQARQLRESRDERLGTTYDERELARRIAGAESHIPVRVVPGWQRPIKRGEGYYWETPSGNICYHPSAYRNAFGHPVYVHSTHRVEVGKLWLQAHT